MFFHPPPLKSEQNVIGIRHISILIYMSHSQLHIYRTLFKNILLIYENLANNLHLLIIIWKPQRNCRASSNGLNYLPLLSSNKYTAENERSITVDDTHELWKKLSHLHLHHNEKLEQLNNSTVGILKT